MTPVRAALRDTWALDPSVTYLNHGSFGACPRQVLATQSELRARLEAEPARFLTRELEPLLDEARAVLAGFVGARADDVVFVPNATTGVNAVLRSLAFAPGETSTYFITGQAPLVASFEALTEALKQIAAAPSIAEGTAQVLQLNIEELEQLKEEMESAPTPDEERQPEA